MTLTSDLRSLLEGRSGTFGVYARDLETNEVAGVGPRTAGNIGLILYDAWGA